MLKNLLKYDLKYVFQVMIVFILLGLFFSGLERILFEFFDNSLIFSIAAKIASGFAISMMVSNLINCFMRNWVRFRNNLYGDEAYLTHTLPIDKKTIYLSKFLCAVITMLIGVISIVVSLVIMYYSKENIEGLKNLLQSFASTYDISIFSFLSFIFIAFFLEMLALLLAGYTGIILGHMSNNSKMIRSILYSFIFYIIMQVVTVLVLFIVGLFNNDIMSIFTTANGANIQSIKVFIYIGVLVYIFYNIIYYIADLKLLKKGINVD